MLKSSLNFVQFCVSNRAAHHHDIRAALEPGWHGCRRRRRCAPSPIPKSCWLQLGIEAALKKRRRRTTTLNENYSNAPSSASVGWIFGTIVHKTITKLIQQLCHKLQQPLLKPSGSS
jgi:hypothetical protein